MNSNIIEPEGAPDEGRPVWTTLNVDGYQHVLAYDTARTAIAGWEDTKAKAKHAVAEVMAEANRAMFSGKHVATLSTSRPRRFNRAAFEADHPDLYERYLEPASEPETRLWVPRRTLLPGFTKYPRGEEP